MTTKQPEGQLETVYREIELRYFPHSQMWVCPLGEFKSADEAMLKIDKHAEDERRISVPVICRSYGEKKMAEAVLIDDRQVWVKLENGRRSKENMRSVFLADAASVAEYKRQNDIIKGKEAELTDLRAARDALCVNAETLLAAHKAAKAVL